MATSYADMLIKINQMLQDPTGTTYDDTTEVAYWIEESLKELATYDPHIVDVIFKIESRTGTDTGSTTTALTDTTKGQFLSTDATLEKVVHNTTDNTWAVIMTDSSTEIQTLTASIMASGESYEIYNKRCRNNKQIFMGDIGVEDVTDHLWIDSVEYPIGTRRNFKVYGDILEIDVDSVQDSDSTKDPPSDIDVLVRFAKPHRLCQLTDLGGVTMTGTDEGEAGDRRVRVKGFTEGEVPEVGDEFYIANHRTLYTIYEAATFNGQDSTGSMLYHWPALEADTVAGDAVTFVSSTLKPHHEELFCHLVAARAVLSDNITKIDAINKGGPDVWQRYQTWGERKLGEVLGKLERLSPPKTKRSYPTD